ncbi:MAG: MetS family NSS transporter small subunit [Cyclobacteriaceae bacterium]
MTTSTIISMILILGIVMGGFAYFLYLVIKKGQK